MGEPEKFEDEAAEGRTSILREYVDFLKASKKYWLIPIGVILLLLIGIIILGGTGAAPFIYTLF